MTRTERTQVRRWLASALKDIEAARRTLALAAAGDQTVAWIGNGAQQLKICENTITSIRERIAP